MDALSRIKQNAHEAFEAGIRLDQNPYKKSDWRYEEWSIELGRLQLNESKEVVQVCKQFDHNRMVF